jgi:hypothetical protein
MTWQTYQADADQPAQEHDQVVPEDNLMDAGANWAEPDADPMAPDADQTGSEDRASYPDGAIVAEGPGPSASIAPDYPGSTPDDGAQEPGMPDTSPASPSLVPAVFTTPESAPDARPARDPASAEAPWNEIQAMFVDDPQASVERAAGLVDGRVEELIGSLRARQHSLQTVWQATNTGTEELRIALQHYRTFWNGLDDLPAQT